MERKNRRMGGERKKDKIVEFLAKKSEKIKKRVIEMILNAKSGHLTSSLSCLDILVSLYYHILEKDDIFILSKGHAAPALYAILIDKGKIPKEEEKKLRSVAGILEGHPEMKIPGIESPSGSLGVGLAVAAGRALAKKLKGEKGYVYVLIGDGEIQEGICWEIFQFINARKLDNLFVIIDRNGLQLSGPTEMINPLEPLDIKLKSFGLWVRIINGHNYNDILGSIENGKRIRKPKVIIALTMKGKGIRELEWNIHGHLLKISEIEKMIKEVWEE